MSPLGDRAFVEKLQIVVIYAALAGLWIYFSDHLLSMWTDDPSVMKQLQTLKGIGFVSTTTLLLYYLIRRMQRRMAAFGANYRHLFQSNPLPMWIYNLQSLKVMLVNDAAIAKYGYSRSEFLNLSIKDLRLAEDVPALLHEVERTANAEESLTASGPWRHQKKDGTLIWVDISGHKLEHDGQPSELIVARDITANVAAQEILQLNAEVFANSQEGIMVTDKNNRIVMVNQAFTDITGYQATEVVGQTPALLKSGKQSEVFYAGMWRTIREQGRWQGEVWNRRKDGVEYPEHLSISTIRNHEGEIEQFIAVFSDRSAERRAEERIEFLANFDPLTGLPNRLSLEKALADALFGIEDGSDFLGLVVMDLDRFKHINDAFGFETGNRLLIEMAARLVRIAAGSGSVFRLGGDEFAIMLPGSSVAAATCISEVILRETILPFDAQGQQVSFTTSLGIAYFPFDGSTPAELLQKADSALSRAKAAGRNNAQFYDESTQTQSLEFLQIESGLRQAILNGELKLYYQPQCDLKTGQLCGLEALVRWQHPQWGFVSPARFIPVAEKSGQIMELGHWIIREAVSQISAWQRDGLLSVPVAINISVIQFRQDELYTQISDALNEFGVAPQCLCVEITESVAMAGSELGVQTIARMHDLGISIAIDDFGSGFSSLSYLKRLKVDKLKIDQSFVRDLVDDPSDHAIVQSIIYLAQKMRFRTIAEGVETEQQLSMLRDMGCEEVQGFYFARPMPVDEVVNFILRGNCG
jgi:diguanylate cyclase (GGDEF)-like protein/PAS domain S-box-containing protein